MLWDGWCTAWDISNIPSRSGRFYTYALRIQHRRPSRNVNAANCVWNHAMHECGNQPDALPLCFGSQAWCASSSEFVGWLKASSILWKNLKYIIKQSVKMYKEEEKWCEKSNEWKVWIDIIVSYFLCS